ncbi:acyltransferase [Diplocarpon rosae]|nr:acyltransferase [Diplocarpon rosae]
MDLGRKVGTTWRHSPSSRLVFCGGHFAVPIFFVVSAYALSVKPLSLIHAEEFDKLGDSFASSIFRRWIRLWMPVCITTFIYMTPCHYPGFYTDEYVQQATYREEVWEWYTQLKNFSFVFDTGGNLFFPFNGHLWTIPVELKGSVAVYMMLIACSRSTPEARLGCMLGLISYFIYVADGCFYAMFMAGVLLADLDLLTLNHQLPRVLTRLAPYKELIYLHLLVVGCYLGGAPTHDQDIMHLRATRGWYYLSFLKPPAALQLQVVLHVLGGAVHRVRGTASGVHQALLREPVLPVPGQDLLWPVPGARARAVFTGGSVV